MNQRDKTILIKITDYCLEIKDTHDYFKQDKELFTNEKNGLYTEIQLLCRYCKSENSLKRYPWNFLMNIQKYHGK